MELKFLGVTGLKAEDLRQAWTDRGGATSRAEYKSHSFLYIHRRPPSNFCFPSVDQSGAH